MNHLRLAQSSSRALSAPANAMLSWADCFSLELDVDRIRFPASGSDDPTHT